MPSKLITMWRCSCVVFAILFVVNIGVSQVDCFVVETTNGFVRGHEAETRDARTIYQWLGIPYAEPPVGDRRFEPPVPVKNWTGTLNAWRYPPQCAQIHIYFESYMGQEDCLYLNVYVPKLKSDKGRLLPVLFAIHGGHFASGQGREIVPDYLLDEDVVLVTPNYRLSVLGFLNTGDDTVRGNMGLKDMRMALKWTYDNIAKFGGDPKRITVQGFSAGAVSANLMFISNSTRDYIHQAMSMSGTAICPWAIHENPVRQAQAFAKKSNCTTSSTKKMVQCLRRLSSKQLLSSLIGSSFLFASYNWHTDDVFVPTIETVITDDTFLSEDPELLMRSGDFKPVPWMVQTVSNEALIAMSFAFQNKTYRASLANPKAWPKILEQFFQLPPDQLARADEIINFYYGKFRDPDSKEALLRTSILFSDVLFNVPQHEAMSYVVGKAPVYAFHYDKPSPVSHFDLTRGIQRRMPKFIEAGAELAGMFLDQVILRKPRIYYGVTHADDSMMYTPYMGFSLSVAYRYSRDYKFSKEYVKLLTGFVSGKTDLVFQGLKVPAYSKSKEFTYFLIRDYPNSGVQQVPNMNRYLFWKAFKSGRSATT